MGSGLCQKTLVICLCACCQYFPWFYVRQVMQQEDWKSWSVRFLKKSMYFWPLKDPSAISLCSVIKYFSYPPWKEAELNFFLLKWHTELIMQVVIYHSYQNYSLFQISGYSGILVILLYGHYRKMWGFSMISIMFLPWNEWINIFFRNRCNWNFQ